jgi:hypothetical protein
VLVIFEIGSCFILGQSRPWSSYLCVPSSWDDRHVPLCPAFIGWDGVSLISFAWLASNLHPLDLCLPGT